MSDYDRSAQNGAYHTKICKNIGSDDYSLDFFSLILLTTPAPEFTLHISYL